MGNEGNRYAPAVSVCVADSTPVAWLVATTFAFTTTAPVASVTVPLSEAVDCAGTLVPKTADRTAKRNTRKNKLREPLNFTAATSINLLLLMQERTWIVLPNPQ